MNLHLSWEWLLLLFFLFVIAAGVFAIERKLSEILGRLPIPPAHDDDD